MLGKLLKYETKATARWFLPMYAGILLFAVLNKIFMLFNFSDRDVHGIPVFLQSLLGIVQAMTIFLYVMIIIATFALTFFIMLQRFYKNLLGDEGYLMFTLPVNASSHIWSKLLVSVFWTVCSVIVTILSVIVMAAYPEMFRDFALFCGKAFEVLFTRTGLNATAFFIELVLFMLVSLFAGNLVFYASISVGHTRGKHRVLYSFIAYIVFYMIQQIVTSLALVIAGMFMDTNYWADLIMDTAPTALIHTILIFSIVYQVVAGVVYYLITNYVLSKKLNLE